MIYQIEFSTTAKHEMIKTVDLDKPEYVDQIGGDSAQGFA